MTKKHSREEDAVSHSRRTFLRVTSAGVGLAFGGVAVGQAQSFELGGAIAGWQGRAPPSIEGQTNPTLRLQTGQQYAITWENVDGQPHNIVILDANGEELERTEIITEQGATQTLEFTATEEMAEYYCEVHPSSMRGQIQIAGQQQQQTTQQQEEAGLIPEGPSIGLQQVAGDPLQQPIGFTYANEDADRRFIVDQNGQIYVHGPNGLQEEPFLDIQEKLYYLTETRGGFERPEEGTFDERGLLGLAFHPDFQNNRRFYIRYSAPPRTQELAGPPDREGVLEEPDHTFVLAEYRASQDLSRGDPKSEHILLEIPEPQFNHNAGDIAFGPDDFLYVTVGDGGGADDTYSGHVDDWYRRNEGGNGQDITQNLLGSILRIDVDTQENNRPYGIPDDNPLVGDTGFPEQWAWGFRNPWRMSFNDGRLFAADVGQSLFEEVNIVEKGGNYGWNVKEGTSCFNAQNSAQPFDQCPDRTPQNVRGGEPLRDPTIEYPHTYQGQSVGISVTGGYVYQGDALNSLQGGYVFGDYSQSFEEPRGQLWIGRPSEQGGETTTTTSGEGTATTTGTGTAPGEGTPATTNGTAQTTTTNQTTTGGSSQSQSEETPWSMEELVVEGSENGEINRFVLAFGRDQNGELYVLGSNTGGVRGNGFVYKIVPPGEGESISRPTQTTTEGTTTQTGTATETGTNTTTGTGNETG